ncbi:MAG: phosphopantothenoylcysteine decarboxylase [Planctomycetaceae bacterium]|jgi:phosphopantothenoylcysteine decarboxylase/phosphopantothenate--cysteine ligase|nr:phosphopantothenoylcysteine decarboxylase [Planctomycetaceae bacterium]
MTEILFGITGGIAAYKAAAAVSKLVQSGFGVDVVMTESATQLIAPKTFEALTNRPVRRSLFDTGTAHLHIELARKAALFCIAPATANILAKAAAGIADDLVSTLILSFDGKILFAPAMNSVMWHKPAVQRNVRQLLDDGAVFIGPETGHLSCGETGTGRMTEPEQIVKEIQRLTYTGKTENQNR